MAKKKVSKGNTPQEFRVLVEWSKANPNGTVEEAQEEHLNFEFDGRVWRGVRSEGGHKPTPTKSGGKTAKKNTGNGSLDVALFARKWGY